MQEQIPGSKGYLQLEIPAKLVRMRIPDMERTQKTIFTDED